MNDIIAIGGTHHNTLSVFRALGNVLGKHCVKAIIVSNDINPYVRYSKYISSFEGLSNVDDLPGLLLSKYTAKEKPIIIACTDFPK